MPPEARPNVSSLVYFSLNDDRLGTEAAGKQVVLERGTQLLATESS